MPTGRLSISLFIVEMVPDKLLWTNSHINRSHRYVRCSISSNRSSRCACTFGTKRRLCAKSFTRCLMTRSISCLMLADSSFPASSMLVEAFRSSWKLDLISKYGRLVIRNFRRDVEVKICSIYSINLCCSCSLHSSRASKTQITSPADGSATAAEKVDQSLGDICENAEPISRWLGIACWMS